MKLNEQLAKAEEQLEGLETQGFDKVDFEWEGIKFHATSTEKGSDSLITLKATLGRLHFTVENKAQRAMALDRLFANNRAVDGQYHIGQKGDIHFESSTKTTDHLRGAKLMSALTVILLEAEKHLRALRAHLKPI